MEPEFSMPPWISHSNPNNSNKRGFTAGCSTDIDDSDDVVEIAPPQMENRRSKLKLTKQKEVLCHEIIDIDVEDGLSDVMIIDEKVGTNYKGKTAFREGSYNRKGKEIISDHGFAVEKIGLENGFQSPSSFVPPSYDSNLDDAFYDLTNDDDEYGDFSIDFDKYDMLQSHFDKFIMPTEVEAPLPWPTVSNSLHSSFQLPPSVMRPTFPLFSPQQPSQIKNYPFPADRINSKVQNNSNRYHLPFQMKEKKSAWSTSAYANEPVQMTNLGVNTVPSMKPCNSRRSWVSPEEKQDRNTPSGSMYKSIKLNPMANSFGAEGSWDSAPDTTHNLFGTNSSNISSSMSWASFGNGYYAPGSGFFPPPYVEQTTPLCLDSQPIIISEGNNLNVDEVLKKFEAFKQFDTADDFSDHHYAKNTSLSNQPQKNWAKAIQDQWRILEKNLPDAIYVRVYENRMDLLRAVIVGAEGTPYHDGLFFFDVYFPCGYPKEPPHVHYHSGGLRLNPNLYNCGKVCLSLLNTWTGNKKERWTPGVSTMLQVLVSIQALILNANPYFNEPGYARSNGTPSGEKRSKEYNEGTFTKSLQTMLYTMRKPPKHFEDFVMGHFCKHAHTIHVSCKAYMDGALVGSLVKGAVQDKSRGKESGSAEFKNNVDVLLSKLVQAFTQVGVKDIEKFVVPVPKLNRNKPLGRRLMDVTYLM